MPNQYTKNKKKVLNPAGGIASAMRDAAAKHPSEDRANMAIAEMVSVPAYELNDLRRDKVALNEHKKIINVLKDEIRHHRLTQMIASGVHVQDAERLSRESMNGLGTIGNY